MVNQTFKLNEDEIPTGGGSGYTKYDVEGSSVTVWRCGLVNDNRRWISCENTHLDIKILAGQSFIDSLGECPDWSKVFPKALKQVLNDMSPEAILFVLNNTANNARLAGQKEGRKSLQSQFAELLNLDELYQS